MSTSTSREIWFVTGSQGLYGEETLRQVASQSQVIAEALDAAPDIVVRVVWKPVLTDASAIRRLCLDATADDACIGLIAMACPPGMKRELAGAFHLVHYAPHSSLTESRTSPCLPSTPPAR